MAARSSGKYYLLVIFFGLILTLQLATATDPECEKWFSKSGIRPGSIDCIVKCTSASVGMDVFHCPSQCNDLCKTALPRYALDQLTYPKGLTEADKNLISKFPKDALKVFESKFVAERAVARFFGDNWRNDESDAFRHFTWAALITEALGAEKARLFLNAHEQVPNQATSEKEMDQSNNDSGIKAAEILRGEGKLTQEEIEKSALKALREKRLKVLSPRGNTPEWSKY